MATHTKLPVQRIALWAALLFSSVPNVWAAPPVALTITNFSRSNGTSVISWAAETNAFNNVLFTVQRATAPNSNFTNLANVSENVPLVYTDSGSSNPAAFYRIVESNAYTSLFQSGAFTAYNAANTSGLDTTGYGGAIFDGRYIYFVPARNDLQSKGIVLRFDTTGDFNTAGSWAAYDASITSGLSTKGYLGGVFDGRYVYFAPNQNVPGYHGNVLRLDTTGNFNTAGSWSAYDASTTSGLDTRGFLGGVFDGRYVYFVPSYNGTNYHGRVLRFDTTTNFTSAGSWSAYDAGITSGLTTKGFIGGVFDGRYIYFVPDYNGSDYSGTVLRFDTTGNFSTAGSWSAYDASITSGLTTKGFAGGVFDGRYVYFVPDKYFGAFHGNVLRFDTTGNFSNAGSWSAYNAGNTSGLTTKGYASGVFDGRYIHFIPDYNGTAYHGTVLRLDTTGDFNTAGSWSAYDAGVTSGLNTKGYFGGVSDGRYIYFSPFYYGTAYHGVVLRFDAKLPRAIPATVRGGSNL